MKFAGREDFFLENNKRVYQFIRDLRVDTSQNSYKAYKYFISSKIPNRPQPPKDIII